MSPKKIAATKSHGKDDVRNEDVLDPTSLQHKGMGYLVRQAHRSFLRVLADLLRSHDITPAQWTLLRALWQEDGYNQVELAQRIHVEKASLTSVLDSLQRRNLIERIRSTEDRRMWNVYLTAAGRRLRLELLPYAGKTDAIAAKGLSAEEVAEFRRLLLRVIVNLQE